MNKLTVLKPISTWHEDDGNVLWHRLDERKQITEPPWCGTPLDDGFMEDYYTHWSPLPDLNTFTVEE